LFTHLAPTVTATKVKQVKKQQRLKSEYEHFRKNDFILVDDFMINKYLVVVVELSRSKQAFKIRNKE